MPTDDDRTAIDRLIRDWVTAVHAGDLEGVLADHADDVVMFDVPPAFVAWPPIARPGRTSSRGRHRARSSRSSRST